MTLCSSRQFDLTRIASQTALQVYARTYKQAPIEETHSLLRKAHRLDQILQVPHHDNSSRLSSEPPLQTTLSSNELPTCAVCKTDCSPFFHPHPKDASKFMCHRCYFNEVETKAKREEKRDVVGTVVMVDA